jgi:hypothetical protein
MTPELHDALAAIVEQQLRASEERIAQRVAALLADRATPDVAGLVDAQAVADALGVSRDTVYANADRLGGRTLDGERGRGRPLRFDLAAAVAAWTACDGHSSSPTPVRPATPTPRPKRTTNPNGTALKLVPDRSTR